MNKALLSIVLAVSMAGCHAEIPQEPKAATASSADRWREKVHAAKRHVLEFGQPRKVAPGAKPEIVLRKNQIYFNGKLLTLGSSLDAWREVLGPETSCGRDYSRYDIHCWKNLGVWVSTSRRLGGRVNSLFIFLNQKPKPWGHDIPRISPVDGQPVAPGIDVYHDHLFRGYLELDGAGVDAQTKVWEVAQLASGDYTYKCIREIRGCSIGPPDQKYATDFSTDSGLEKGIIYRFEIGLFD